MATLILVAGVGIGLWATWDSTRVSDGSTLTAGPSPLLSTTTSRSTTTVPELPACGPGDEPVEGDPLGGWSTIVIDTNRALPPDFAPPDLVEVTAAGFAQRDRVREFVVADLADLRLAAEANGTPIVVIS